jgi:hypothetical protein
VHFMCYQVSVLDRFFLACRASERRISGDILTCEQYLGLLSRS